MIDFIRQRFGFFIAHSLLGAVAIRAGKMPAKLPVLVVTGNIRLINDAHSYAYDMGMLADMPQHSITTHTPWYPEPHTFTGPLLGDVLNRVGARGSRLETIALNGYRSAIPVEDAVRFDVIIARLMDGERMRIPDKGPLCILYPFDQEEKTRSPTYYGRSVWQLQGLHVE